MMHGTRFFVGALVLAMPMSVATASAQPSASFAMVGSKSLVPGTGMTFDRFDRPVRSPDGTRWMMLARNTTGSSSDAMFITGQGTAATLEWQESIDVVPEGRTATTFDRYVAINNAGDWVRLLNLEGASDDDGLLLRGTAGGSGVYTIPAREGQPKGAGLPGQKYGRFNYAPNASTAGNVSFGSTIDGLSIASDLYYFSDNGATVLAYKSGPGPSGQFGGSFPWDNSFATNSLQVSGNEQYWLLRGKVDSGNSSADEVLVLNNQVVAQEGSDIGGIGNIEFMTGDQNQLTEDGNWFLRGRIAGGDGFAARSGTILAKEGKAVPGTVGENWDGLISTSSSAITFFVSVGNNLGDYVVGGFTDNSDPDRNAVCVFNDELFLRSGDRIDLDGDGVLDDAFIYFSSYTTASPKSYGGFLTDDLWFYFLADVRNGANVNLGEAFLRVRVPEPTSLSLLALGGLALLRRRWT